MMEREILVRRSLGYTLLPRFIAQILLFLQITITLTQSSEHIIQLLNFNMQQVRTPDVITSQGSHILIQKQDQVVIEAVDASHQLIAL